ncbi:hypothetical protein PR003_g15995 [Phytophthora rubi]|uniref:Uncharacterized protein n=1 Tax=Phytophthora rubi TaxID=129364 RepID=A0A6A3L3S3_9STRA|nr:hypothetical protein PR002_g15605 [Phytophthora rubi]KAE9014252.1 hypothetical protein PR001_g15190 [Phytophthora rubi]KAE9327558.1 hypothetical protein PR003_g15995 [Phytophthora rubi]
MCTVAKRLHLRFPLSLRGFPLLLRWESVASSLPLCWSSSRSTTAKPQTASRGLRVGARTAASESLREPSAPGHRGGRAWPGLVSSCFSLLVDLGRTPLWRRERQEKIHSARPPGGDSHGRG